MYTGKHYLFGKEISPGKWTTIVKSVIKKEVEKAWDNLYKDLDQGDLIKKKILIKYIKDTEEKIKEKETETETEKEKETEREIETEKEKEIETDTEKETETRNWDNECLNNL